MISINSLQSISSLAVSFVLVFSLQRFLVYWISIQKRQPPGPRGHWLVGHTFQVPTTKTWLYFDRLGKEHGPVVKLTLAGDDIIVLNRARDAEELLGQRSSKYSSRKPLIYAGKYMSNNKRMVLMSYGPKLKIQRQVYHQMLQPKAVGAYESMQVAGSEKLLFDMLRCPEDAFINVKRFSASLVFALSYGRRLSPDDADLKEVLTILDGFTKDCYPGTHLVDTFPILDSWWIPEWMASWRAEAKGKHARTSKFYIRLLNEVKSRMDSGETSLECFSARLWDQKEKFSLDLETMAYIAGSAFEAGTGTTSGTLLFFLEAMVLHPYALKKSQQEIDGVIGDNEPPTFRHISLLPYTLALCKEVLRWMPVGAGGFPHYSDEEDTYLGYEIAARTMVVPNIWSMHRDASMFSEPDKFQPERWSDILDNKVQTNSVRTLTEGHWGFGFGRRVCPGQYMAVKTVWIGIVQLLWAFDIRHAIDVQGNRIKIDTEAVTSGITMEPEPFELSITPRSPRHAETIRKMWVKNEFASLL